MGLNTGSGIESSQLGRRAEPWWGLEHGVRDKSPQLGRGAVPSRGWRRTYLLSALLSFGAFLGENFERSVDTYAGAVLEPCLQHWDRRLR